MEQKKIWLLIFDDLSETLKIAEKNCSFLFRWHFRFSQVTGFCCRYGSQGFRSHLPKPCTVPLCSLHQSTALLPLVMSSDGPHSALPLPAIPFFSLSYVVRAPDWHKAWVCVPERQEGTGGCQIPKGTATFI